MALPHTTTVHNKERLEDWHCFCEAIHYETRDPTRPPNYNQQNCCCAETGTPLNDPQSAALVNGMTNLGLYSPRDAYSFHPAATASSEGGSIRAPEGPERKDPSVQFLALAPEGALGLHYRLQADLDKVPVQLTYGINRFLATLTPVERLYHEASLEYDDRDIGLGGKPWVRQNNHFVFVPPAGDRGYSMKAANGSSEESMESSGYLETRHSECHIDQTRDCGHWTEAFVLDRPDTLMIDEYDVETDSINK